MFKDRHIEIKLAKPQTIEPENEAFLSNSIDCHIDQVVEVAAQAGKFAFGALMCVKVYNTLDKITTLYVESKLK